VDSSTSDKTGNQARAQRAGRVMLAPSCILSKCGLYRYSLTIPLAETEAGGSCLFVLANPSTAVVTDGVFQSDPTVTRCINYARAWGFGRVVVANVRAWRETDPKKVPPDPLAIGPENDEWICGLAAVSHLIVAGWGKLGGARGPKVLSVIRDVDKVPHALRLNGDGSPCHPLYLPSSLKPFPMEAA
jgi:hypothetical protein